MATIYETAYDIQDASNPLAVVRVLHETIIPGIRAEYKAEHGPQWDSWPAIEEHPAFAMIVDKLRSMVRIDISTAYELCRQKMDHPVTGTKE